MKVRTFNSANLARLEDEHDAARGAFIASTDLRDEALVTFSQQNAYLRQLQEAREPSSSHIAHQKQVVEEAKRKLDRHSANVERLSPRRAATNMALRAVTDYISKNKLKPSDDVQRDYAAPGVSAGQFHKAIEKTRSEIQALVEKREAIGKRHVSREVAEQRIAAEFSKWESHFGADIGRHLFAPDGSAAGAFMRSINISTNNPDGPTTSTELNPKLFLALISKQAKAYYADQISSFYDSQGPGMSDKERVDAQAQLSHQILALEQKEEAIIRAAAAAGIAIDRRTSANPEVMLGPIDERELEDPEYVPRAVVQRKPGTEHPRAALPNYHKGPLTAAGEMGLDEMGAGNSLFERD